MFTLLMYLTGLIVSIVTSFFSEGLGVYSLLIYLLLGLIIGFLMWPYAEYALFPVTTLLLAFFAVYFLIINLFILESIIGPLFSAIIFTATVAVILAFKYLHRIRPSSR
ncbi:hypothetical protein B6U80_00175 [Candidatus Pacearchaeota archaeon ex4484_26]|nr:MAG: hypothetical protein B6U80_00175 [Candidatus Pacearchaeota archaeon ex4484_26]